MTDAVRRALIVVPPTVGHLNHGIALAELLAEARWQPVLVTGSGGREHLSKAPAWITCHALPSHDLNLDRNDPLRRPHLEQLCEPAAVTAALDDELDLLARYRAEIVVAKDYFAAVLAAARAGIPRLGYFTDGVEAMLTGSDRQTVADSDRLSRQLAQVAVGRGIEVELAPVPETLRSPVLNIVRGYPETSAVPTDGLDASTAFAGALTYDGSAAEVDHWTNLLGGLKRPVVYATFGTVLRDRSRLAVVRQAGARLPGSVVLADLGAAQTETGAAADVHTYRYVPNRAALARADVAVHHGGHGTTLSALVAGVPQIVVPDNERTQQRTHGEVLVGLGVGALIPRAELTVSALVDTVTELRAPDVRARAADLARRLRSRDASLRRDLVDRLAGF